MNHECFSAEHKLKILKRCFEGTASVRDVAIEKGVSHVIIYSWRNKYLKMEYLDCSKRSEIAPYNV